MQIGKELKEDVFLILQYKFWFSIRIDIIDK